MDAIRAWEIRKIHDASPSLPAQQHRGVTLLIAHDHTINRRQRTVIAAAGRLSRKQAAAKISAVSGEIGYALGQEIPDMAVFLAGASGSYRRFWAAGKTKQPRPVTPPAAEADGVAPPGEANPEGGHSQPERLFFPQPGTGVLIAARSSRRKWIYRVWAYGDHRRDTRDAASLWAASISGRASKAVTRSKSLPAAAVSAAAAAVFGTAGLAGLAPFAAAAAVSALAGLCFGVAWWRFPTRRSATGRGVPAGVVRAMRPSRRAGKLRRGVEFTMDSAADPSVCADVAINSAILPDMGGVAIGTDGAGDPVRIPDRDRYVNITVVGAPGSGKTTMMLQIAGGDMMRMRNGENNTLIWFETKQDGAPRLLEIAEKAGLEPLYFTPGSSQGPQLRWLDWSDPRAASGTLTESFVASFDQASIQEQSRDVIAGLLDMASLAWPAHLKAVGEERMNLMRTAWILSGGLRWQKAENLMEQIKNNSPDQERYRQCQERLGIYYGLPERDRDQRMAAARNKLNRLKDFPAWTLDLRRPSYTWRDILEMRRPVIVDISKFDDASLSGYSEEMIRILLPTALYTFWSEAQYHCGGWYEQNRSVALYCDEASNLGGNSGRILTQISTQGRSHGVSLVLGAQGWTQLSEMTQLAFRQAGHKCFFGTADSESAAALAQDFTADPQANGYNHSSLTRLKPFENVAVIRIGSERYGPVLLRTTDDRRWDPLTAWEPAVPVP